MSGRVSKLVNGIHSFKNLSKDNMAPIQPARDNRRDKELRAVRVWAGIRHGQQTWLRVFASKVFVSKLGAVAALREYKIDMHKSVKWSQEKRRTWRHRRSRQNW